MHENLIENTIQMVYKTYLQEQYHHTLLDLHGRHQQTTMTTEHFGTTLSDAWIRLQSTIRCMDQGHGSHQDTLQCSQEQLQ